MSFPFDIPEIFSAESEVISVSRQYEGTHFHNHGRTAFVLAEGKKLWLLYSPYNYPADLFQRIQHTSPMEFYENVVPSLDPPPIQVIQNPGDLLYFPDNYLHFTLNLEFSIGFAKQAQTLRSNPPIGTPFWCMPSMITPDWKELIKVFTMCDEIYPFYPQYYYDYVIAMRRFGKKKKAKKMLQKFSKHMFESFKSEKCHNCHVSMLMISDCWYALKENKKALKWAKRAQTMKPEDIFTFARVVKTEVGHWGEVKDKIKLAGLVQKYPEHEELVHLMKFLERHGVDLTPKNRIVISFLLL